MDQQIPFFGFSEKPRSWRKLLPYALLLGVTLALYATAIYFDFVWDDFRYIIENYRIQGLSAAHLKEIWTHPYLGLFAPIHLSILAILHSLFGLQPYGYHLCQILIHAACVCLLYRVLEKIESARVALLACLLFAVYPPNSETVAWISETKSTLAFLFFLLSFGAFLRLRERESWRDGIICSLFLILSLLAKINTVVAPAIFLLYDYKQGYLLKKGRAWSLGWFFLIGAIFTGIHLASFNPTIHASAEWLKEVTLPDNRPANFFSSTRYYGGFGVHLLNLPRLILFHLRMLVFPYPLSAWRMFRVHGEMNWNVGASWIALLGLLWVLVRSSRGFQFWQLWFYVFLAPVMQIVPMPIWSADRYLYIPAIGGFVVASKLFISVADRLGKLWLRLTWEAAMTAILVAFAWHTARHLPVWRNDLELWEATTKTCMTSAYCHASLGRALLANDAREEALKEFARAVQIRPAPFYLAYLGDTFAEMFGDFPRAILAFQIAERSTGLMPPDFWATVAKTYYMAGDLEQARRAIEAGRKTNADEPSLLIVSGFLQWKQGDWEGARRTLSRVLAMNQQTSNPAKFINYYWKHPGEVVLLMNDLGPL